MRFLASLSVLCVLVGCGLGAAAPGPAVSVAIVDRQFFEQCPLDVPHPSVTLVTDTATWGRMLAAARTAPPPFDVAATAFEQRSVIVIATRTTPTPRTRLSLVDGSVTYGPEKGSLRLAVTVDDLPPPVGQLTTAVVGMPCMVAWTSRVSGVDAIEVRRAGSSDILVEARRPMR